MSSLNRVIIMGNITQDIELKYTQGGTAVCQLNVATNEFKQGQNGEREQTTEYHSIVVWAKQAENCANYLAKGRGVLVEGRLQTRSWDDQQTGAKRYKTEIVASNVQFLPQSSTSNTQGGNQGYANNNGGNMNQNNFQNNQGNQNGFMQNPNQGTNQYSNQVDPPSGTAFDNIPF